MAGYLVFPEEVCDWSGNVPGKIPLNPVRMGLFDLIREFEQDPFPFDRRSPGLALIRLDELMVHLGCMEGQAENLDWPVLADFHRRLRAVAQEVSNMGVIHVPVSCHLDLGGGNQLYARYTGKRIPLWRLFGANPTLGNVGGHTTYLFGDNLS
ncbi:MAG: hypothetical protein LV481_11160 [Methylacidiphilales bacterium]|nr:hypothetical protein [Candidatus Methylacidiphilales bacterium]